MHPADIKNTTPFDRLVAAIEVGELPPGSRLLETELAKRLGISRTPVREALHRLQALGLAQQGAQRGLVVAELNYQKLRQLFAVREGIEGLCARLAAQNATAEEHEMLQDLIDMDRNETDPEILSARNAVLHRHISYATHNTYMMETVDSLRLHLVLLPGSTYTFPKRLKEAQEEHEKIVQAIVDGDADAAEKAAREHIAHGFRVRIMMMSTS
ncbi:GntR family transcriptional regulator [Tropicimonas sp. IMCC34043]|uniref:GntR family transcriptional regulator n=1 Tax=Tropicimonas sp. IMCC34043 TaxID=2248760 RepID=UPI000E24FDD7|nr:GntR family transcriptional regulator [Tropicimonas sp. IMCC34043]